MECDEIARRVKILEAPTVMANEFKETGEKRNQAAIRAGERLFQEYDSKVSYDSCTIAYAIILINPQRMRRGVIVVSCLSVCVLLTISKTESLSPSKQASIPRK